MLKLVGDSFNILDKLFESSICVDPSPHALATHTMTSDTFFETNTKTFDVIFIDGLHLAHQVAVDVSNAIAVLNPNGFIVMHDCNPRHKMYQLDKAEPAEPWTGDAWKVAVALRAQYGLDMIIGTVDH